jgi:hypothetical protein
MQSQAGGLGPIKIECLNRFAHIHPQFLPGVCLSENALAKRFGYITTVRLLRNIKNKLVHGDASKRRNRLPASLVRGLELRPEDGGR